MVELMIAGNPAFDARFPQPEDSPEREFFASAVHAARKLQRARRPIDAATLKQLLVPEFSELAVEEVVTLPKFRHALKARGILLADERQALSARQLAFLAVYLDMSVPMNHAQRLKAAKVTQAQFDGWMQHAEFAAELEQLSEDRLTGLKPLVAVALAGAIEKGERWALELHLEMTGRHDRRQAQIDVQGLLMNVYSILDEELSQLGPAGDTALARIGDKLRALQGQGVRVVPTTLAEPLPIEG